jgi:hypothetical protein
VIAAGANNYAPRNQRTEDVVTQVALREVAFSRAGEKGPVVYVSVIAHDIADYPLLLERVTADSVQAAFAPILTAGVERFEVPLIGALNFALYGGLGGGRSRNLAFDESGKALSSRMLALWIEVPAGYITRSERVRAGAL